MKLKAHTLFAYFLFTSLILPAQTIPFDPDVISGKLDNGLHYYVKKNKKPKNRAELRLVLKVGSILEDEDQLGIAHFVEHMAFNGSKNFAKNELINFLELTGTRFGADLNAYTSFDETVYKLQVRTDSVALLDQGMLVLSDWASGITFDPEEIDKERGVVISEWRNRLNPDQRLQQQYYPILFQDSRYANRLPIGDPSTIENVPPRTIKRFYENWYRPELMAIVVVGDINPEDIIRKIKANFSRLRAQEPARNRTTYTIPFHKGTRSIVATDPEASFTQIRLQIKQSALENKTVDDFAERLKVSLYNKMLGLRMYELQQTSNPPFTFATTSYSTNTGGIDAYSISAFVGADQAKEGFESVYRETIRALQYGFTSSELERAKKDLLSAAEKNYNDRENIQSARIANNLSYHFLEENPVLNAGQYLELLQHIFPGIQVQDINLLPKKWIDQDNRTLIITAPEKVKSQLPSPQGLITSMQEIEASKLPPYIYQTANKPLFDKSLQVGAVLTETVHAELGVQEWILSNGIKVILKPSPLKEDEILVQAFRPGGHSLAEIEDYQSATAAVTLANLSGLANFNSPDLFKKLSGKIINVGPYISEYAEGIGGNSSKAELETLLQLIHLYFTAPRFSQQSLEGYRQRQANVLTNITDNPYYYFANLQSKIKYQNHPRRQGIPSLEDLDQIDLEVAEAFYKERFSNADDFTFIFVGSFESKDIQHLIEKYLGSLPAKNRISTFRDLKVVLAPGIVDTTIQRGQAPKALVDITFHGDFEYTPENRYHFASMISILNIKLRENLREELGGVYGVRLNGNNTRVPREKYKIGISFNADPKMVDTLINTTFKVIKDLQASGPEDIDLQKIKETQIQSRIKAEEENSFWMAQLKYRYQNDLPLTGATFETFQNKVKALTAEEIQEAAQSYFDFENRIKMILLPEEEE